MTADWHALQRAIDGEVVLDVTPMGSVAVAGDVATVGAAACGSASSTTPWPPMA